MTFICTAFTGIIAFKIFKEKSVIAPISESSTAGNAVSTPAAVVAAASTALANGNLSQSEFAMIEKVAPIATAQISISAITTAILCPIAVILVDRYQKVKEYMEQRNMLLTRPKHILIRNKHTLL